MPTLKKKNMMIKLLKYVCCFQENSFPYFKIKLFCRI